jgi:hypothetical protein
MYILSPVRDFHLNLNVPLILALYSMHIFVYEAHYVTVIMSIKLVSGSSHYLLICLSLCV